MDRCGICTKPAVQLFETGKDGVFACFKCQPLVPEVSLGQDQSDHQIQQDQEYAMIVEGLKTESNQLTCPICNKVFEKNMQLQNHIRNHKAERKFVCTYCNKGFSQSNNLRAHLRIHTNERPYKCRVCDKAFTQVTNLNNHVRLHTGERPFACPEPGCDKAYAQVTNLNQHRKRHYSGRPLEDGYACSICGQQFQQRNHMYAHRREAHSELKSPLCVPHVCQICDAAFTTEKKFKTHVAQHMAAHTATDDDDKSESAVIKCVFSSCGERFSLPAQHTEHLLKAHQLRVLSVPDAKPVAKRGRPRKVKGDPLDTGNNFTYEIQVEHLKEGPSYVPKLKVERLFQ